MAVIANDGPLPFHYWMVSRIGFFAQFTRLPEAFVSVYSCPQGIYEGTAADPVDGWFAGTSINVTTWQGDDLLILDYTPLAANQFTYIADEQHSIYLPANRVLGFGIYGITWAAAYGWVQIDVQYTDWIMDVPKDSVSIPVEPIGSEEDTA
jgi:hypothetical protein